MKGSCFMLGAGCLLFSCSLRAQEKAVVHNSQLWTGYFNQVQFSRQWGVWIDLHLRTGEGLAKSIGQSIMRVGLIRYGNSGWRYMAGYAYVNNFVRGGTETLALTEHRLWQQVQQIQEWPKLRFNHALRLEERWRQQQSADGRKSAEHLFTWRVKHTLSFQRALGKKAFAPGSIALVLSNDLFINFGKQVINNYFDQDRFFAGLAWQMDKHSALQTGYMKIFQQLPAGNRFRSTDVLRCYFIHQFDLRKKH